jgi:serine/threonine protein kinase
MASAMARHRFKREAIAASGLNHPHILTVHETGEIDSHRYLVTEFIDGGTLAEWARSARPTDVACREEKSIDAEKALTRRIDHTN